MFSLNIKCRIEPSSRRNRCCNPEKMHMCDWVTREMEKKKFALVKFGSRQTVKRLIEISVLENII